LLIFKKRGLDIAASKRDADQLSDMEEALNRFVKISGICLSCCATGCGTFVNTVGGIGIEPEYRIYGGVRSDVKGETKMWADGLNATKEIDAESLFWGTSIGLIDTPLCIVADTLTLPWVIYRQIAPPKSDAGAKSELSSQAPNVPEK
jgi:uncharacterized protein YceK